MAPHLEAALEEKSLIPDNVQELLRDRVGSVDRLLVLLLMHAEPARSWRTHEVATWLGIGEQSVQSALNKLVESELCRQAEVGVVTFAPGTQVLANDVSSLAELYAAHPGEVLVFISQMAISRVRSEALRTFAEAFRFNRSKKNDG